MNKKEKIIGVILWVVCFILSPVMLLFMLVGPWLAGFWRTLLAAIDFPNLTYREYEKRIKQNKKMYDFRDDDGAGLN